MRLHLTDCGKQSAADMPSLPASSATKPGAPSLVPMPRCVCVCWQFVARRLLADDQRSYDRGSLPRTLRTPGQRLDHCQHGTTRKKQILCCGLSQLQLRVNVYPILATTWMTRVQAAPTSVSDIRLHAVHDPLGHDSLRLNTHHGLLLKLRGWPATRAHLVCVPWREKTSSMASVLDLHGPDSLSRASAACS